MLKAEGDLGEVAARKLGGLAREAGVLGVVVIMAVCLPVVEGSREHEEHTDPRHSELLESSHPPVFFPLWNFICSAL